MTAPALPSRRRRSRRVGVEDLAPATGLRQADPVAGPRHWREVGDHRDRPAPRRPTQPREHRLAPRRRRRSTRSRRPRNRGRGAPGSRGTAGSNRAPAPAEPRCGGHCSRCQSRLWSSFHSRRCAELLAHEQQLLAGMAPHEAVIGAQVGELLPVVAGHLAQRASPCRAPPRRGRAAGRSSR